MLKTLFLSCFYIVNFPLKTFFFLIPPIEKGGCRGRCPLWWRAGRRYVRSQHRSRTWSFVLDVCCCAALRSKKMGACRMTLCFPECVRCGTCGSCAACSAMRKHEGNDNAVSSCFHPFFPCVRDGSPERQRQHCWLCSRQPGTRGERPICQNLTL